MSTKSERRKRRAFTKEYKAQVVGLVRDSGRGVGDVATELGLTVSAVRQWVKQAEVDEGRGPPGALTTAEREELTKLRREVRNLRAERDILKKATVASTGQGNASTNASSGVLKPRVLRGRVFNARAVLFSCP
jgi:transposase